MKQQEELARQNAILLNDNEKLVCLVASYLDQPIPTEKMWFVGMAGQYTKSLDLKDNQGEALIWATLHEKTEIRKSIFEARVKNLIESYNPHVSTLSNKQRMIVFLLVMGEFENIYSKEIKKQLEKQFQKMSGISDQELTRLYKGISALSYYLVQYKNYYHAKVFKNNLTI